MIVIAIRLFRRRSLMSGGYADFCDEYLVWTGIISILFCITFGLSAGFGFASAPLRLVFAVAVLPLLLLTYRIPVFLYLALSRTVSLKIRRVIAGMLTSLELLLFTWFVSTSGV